MTLDQSTMTRMLNALLSIQCCVVLCQYRFQFGVNTNLWWSTSNGVVSRSCGESSALEFSANLVEKVAITRPHAMQAAPTIPVVLREGFNVTSDSTRLVSEGYESI